MVDKKNVKHQSHIIHRPPTELVITTDSSRSAGSGWGCVYESSIFNGCWTEEEAVLHINALRDHAAVVPHASEDACGRPRQNIRCQEEGLIRARIILSFCDQERVDKIHPSVSNEITFLTEK